MAYVKIPDMFLHVSADQKNYYFKFNKKKFETMLQLSNFLQNNNKIIDLTSERSLQRL